MKAKYVIVLKDGVEVGYLFPYSQSHMPTAFRLRLPIIAAGVCVFDKGEFNCYGDSKSLNVGSRPGTDADVLNKWFR